MKNKLTVLIFFILISCKNEIRKDKSVVKRAISIKENIKATEFSLDSFLQQFVSSTNYTNDSVCIEKLYLGISTHNKKDKYQYYVEKYGNIFDNKYKYIQVIDQNNKNLNIYIIKNKGVLKIISFEKTTALHKSYIDDINKDGFNDFILLYQTTGPEEYHAYLFNKNGFVDKEISTYNYFPITNNEFVQVINHQSPIVELKKMKWQGTSVDTIEKIYYDYNNPVYYKSNKYPYKEWEGHAVYIYDPTVKAKILKKLPNDYVEAMKMYYPELVK